MRARLSLIGVAVLLVGLACTNPAERSEDAAKTHPRQVLLIRHGEKPPEGDKSTDLNARGKERAAALPNLFKKSATRPQPFTTPDYIFATKNTKSSHRPVETVTPLARSLGLTISAEYTNDDYAKLADHLLKHTSYTNKTILVSWHHGKIPDLAHTLGASNAPNDWKGTVFDRVWQLTYDEKGKVTFLDLPQHLLPGDSDK